MTNGDDAVRPLREALSVSPANVPLRQHLADTLASLGRLDEAADEYRQALSHAPDNERLKLRLAEAYYGLDKNSHALVIVEDFLKRSDTPPAAYVLHARLLIRAGDVARAVRQYKTAIELDPGVADSELAQRLGIGADDQFSEVVDGRLRAGLEEASAPLDAPIERPKITWASPYSRTCCLCSSWAFSRQCGPPTLWPVSHPGARRGIAGF